MSLTSSRVRVEPSMSKRPTPSSALKLALVLFRYAGPICSRLKPLPLFPIAFTSSAVKHRSTPSSVNIPSPTSSPLPWNVEANTCIVPAWSICRPSSPAPTLSTPSTVIQPYPDVEMLSVVAPPTNEFLRTLFLPFIQTPVLNPETLQLIAKAPFSRTIPTEPSSTESPGAVPTGIMMVFPSQSNTDPGPEMVMALTSPPS
mmetsp:Transcript_28719/g.53977  ORF Transcript_28719/g.53977 Transcript_28719/m.53977 type:complete len:201 (-) Transcript_28719:518-1120(-)